MFSRLPDVHFMPRLLGGGTQAPPKHHDFPSNRRVPLTVLATAGPDRYRWVVTDLRRAGGGPWRGIRQVWRSNRNVARVAWRVCAATLSAAGAAVALMHVWIFWDQLASGRLLDGASALRWTCAAALCAMVETLRRRGVSLWWGRQAFSVWLLVALLHAWSASPAAAGVDMTSRDPAHEAAATFLIPVTTLVLTSLVGLLLIVGGRTRRSPLASVALLPLDPMRPPACWRASAVRVPRAPPALPA